MLLIFVIFLINLIKWLTCTVVYINIYEGLIINDNLAPDLIMQNS